MSLADKISDLLSTTPASFDPDEEDTNAKLTERNPDDIEDETTTGEYRKQNVDLLEDVDVKYAGRSSSRKNLARRDWDSDADDVIPSSENDDGNGTHLKATTRNRITVSGDGTDSEAAESEENHEAPSKVEHSFTPDDGTIQVHASDTSGEVKKGLCVRNQLSIWENLLEIRIQLQKCLQTANKMPQASVFNDIKAQSGEAFVGKVSETRKNIAGALDKLLLLQNLLLKQQHPETETNDDEEIQSDSDAAGEEQEEEEKMERPRKRRKLMHYEKTVAVNHEKYKAYRNSVIQKWHDKTRIGIVTAKSGNPTHSILNQIEYHLAETKEKLRKRTQMKRSDYEILGEPRTDDEYNSPEIFDDDDFYHQLLRELIEVKSADVTDPVQLGRQWIRLQSLRSKMKRKIDTRATKGRKVRYTVHAKLVNFTAPFNEGSSWTDEAKTELFGSLFGKSRVEERTT